MSVNELSCFGKLPIHSDFIRFQTLGEEIHALDQWFQEGIHYTKSRLGSNWNGIFRQTAPWNFVFHTPGSPSFLVGVFVPSQDRSGRSYPFFLYLRINKKEFGGSLSFAPLCFAQFLNEARNIVMQQWDGVDLKTFLSRMQEIQLPRALDVGSVEKDYIQTLENQSNRNFWTSLFGEFNHPRKYQLYRNLIEVLHPMRGQSSSTLRFGLHFPLFPQALLDGEKGGYDISYWFDFVFHWLKVDQDPVFFWQREGVNDIQSLLAFFSPPTSKQFLSLLQTEENHEAWFNLVSSEEDDPEKHRAGMPEEQISILEDGEISLAHFIEASKQIQ